MEQMDALLAALADERSCVPLDVAALELAQIEYPELDHEPSLRTLDLIASNVAGRISPEAGGPDFVRAANHVLFRTCGFRANKSEYYDPRNTFLNDVLERRTGIPISLSVVYMEVSRRLARPVYGIGLPGHFLVQYEDREYAAFIDPFNRGAVLDAEQCAELAKSTSGVEIGEDKAALTPVSTRYILVRMLNNLKAVYGHGEKWDKLVPVLDLLLHADPGNAEDHKLRGVACLHLQRLQEARKELTRFIELRPDAEDAEAVKAHLKKIHGVLASLN